MSRDRRYWRQTSRLTTWLLLLWVGLTFGVTWFARELNQFVIFGFPFGFYYAAQGVLLCYLVIILFYIRRMSLLDAGHENEEA